MAIKGSMNEKWKLDANVIDENEASRNTIRKEQQGLIIHY